MKKAILLTSILAVGAAYAEPTAVTCGNAIGALNVAINRPAAQTLVAVPFLGYQAGDAVAVKDMVKTSDLGEGSKLYVPNDEGSYNTWTLNAGGEWDADDYVSIVNGSEPTTGTSPNQDEAVVNRGDAFWIEPKADSATIYLLGQASTVAGKSVVEKGWNLIGNTGTGTSSKELNVASPANGDQVVVQVDGMLRYYTYYGGKGWAYLDDDGLPVKGAPAIESGKGLWYFRSANASSDVNW